MGRADQGKFTQCALSEKHHILNSSWSLMSSIRTDLAEHHVRWGVWLLMIVSIATMLGRIASVCAPTGESPMLSANDRSRWSTVRAVVEDGTYAIDRLVRIKDPVTGRRFWKSIDMVRHRGPDGREHYYSSKPPLFSTMLAGVYWVFRAVTGATFENEPFLIMRVMLVLTNVLPLLLYFVVLWRLVERLADTHAARLYTMAAAMWGTFLTTFAVTLNNHLPAAICVLLATSLALHIWWGERRWWYFAGAGLCGAFAVANELPALSFFGLLTLAVAGKSVRGTVVAFLPAAALVAAAFLGTNYLAHGTPVPAYAHRSDGPVIATVPRELTRQLDDVLANAPAESTPGVPSEVLAALTEAGTVLSDDAILQPASPGVRWVIWDRQGHVRLAVVATDERIEIRRWDNWYDYSGSYWTTERQGVDRGEASRGRYVLHVLIGHHGIFSLTPIWLLSVAGVVLLMRSRKPEWVGFGWLVVLLTFVCLAFYLSRPLIDRNYGGVSCGFRWMFWFTPLWLLCLVPAADRWLTGPRGRVVALLLLLISTFSATYAAANPWSHPWLWDWGTYAGWWQY